MAKVSKLVPLILKWEGGYVNDHLDKGGSTNKGVTISTFRFVFGNHKTIEDLKNITDEEFMTILKKYYWDRWRGDEIENQSIANILVDWVWASGVHGIKIPQRILDVRPDGLVGGISINALNNYPQQSIFEKIKQARRDFVYGIVARD